MVEPEKPFACTLPDCGMTFTNEDHLHVHTKKHDMVLQLGLEQKAAFVADQTPTPTRFIRNCEEVGLFQDLQNVNPFDEGFKRAMETKHGILSLESVIAASASDDVLHTPQMVFPLIDSGDSTLFSANNQRNIIISRSSSDESGTIKEYETTTISKLTNEVTTISRIVNKDILDKITTTEEVKITDVHSKDSVVHETVYKDNVIKIHSNVEIRKDANTENDTNAPIIIFKDSTGKDNSASKDILLNDNKLQVPEKLPPIMSQKSIDFVVDSLTSDLNTEAVEDKRQEVDIKPGVAVTKLINDVPKAKLPLNNNKPAKVTKKIFKKPKIQSKDDTKVKPKVNDDDYEVIIKLPNGNKVLMRAVEEIPKPDTKEILRRNLTNKMKPPPLIPALKKAPVQNVFQIPTGTLIPVTLVNQAGNPISVKNIPINSVPVTKISKIPVNGNPISVNNNILDNIIPVIPVVPGPAQKIKVASIAPKNVKCPPPFTGLKISPPYQVGDVKSKGSINTDTNIIVVANLSEKIDTTAKSCIEGSDDNDCVIEEVTNNPEVAKRTRYEMASRCAASKRYRERLRNAMRRQTEENRKLREANHKLTAERAALKYFITEHMKRCTNAYDLRVIQERLQGNTDM